MITTATRTDLEARAAWSLLTEPGDQIAGRFTQAIGHEDALAALDHNNATTLLLELGAADTAADARSAVDRWRPRRRAGDVDHLLGRAEKLGIQLVDPSDVPGVRDLHENAPHVLWVRGDVDALHRELPFKIAVIGARAATGYGDHVAQEIVTDLTHRGITIVSGAAYGIDGTAHNAALAAGGSTIAWLAGGIDRPYPAGHTDLIGRIATSPACAVVSEVPIGATPTKWRFLNRNRLIAATTTATVVIEAGWRSGSISTADHAVTLHRSLGAVPGPVTSPSSAGCHRLIRDHGAQLITGADDAYELLGR